MTRTSPIRVLLLSLVVVATTGFGRAAFAEEMQKAPFAVSGWKYVLGPNATHFYLCQTKACGPNSKVSWVRLSNPSTFEQYKAGRRKLADLLNARLPPGTSLTFDEPKNEHAGNTEIFLSSRHVTAPDGRTSHTYSRTITGPKEAIDLISSSDDQASAEANVTLFMIPIFVIVDGSSQRKADAK